MTRWRLRSLFVAVRVHTHSSKFFRKRLTFGWCQMIDRSQLTRCCQITVVWVDPATTTLLRRWSCCCSDMVSVADQRWQTCCCRYRCRFSGYAPQCNSLHFFDSFSTAVEFWLIPWWSYIVNLSHTGDHWLSPVQIISFSVASCWVVGLDDVMDSSGLWLAGRIYRRCGSLVVKSMTNSLFIQWRRHPIYTLRLYTSIGVRHHRYTSYIIYSCNIFGLNSFTQTDRWTEFSSLDRVCIPCSTVKTDQYISVNNILVIKFCLVVEPTSEGGVRSWDLE